MIEHSDARLAKLLPVRVTQDVVSNDSWSERARPVYLSPDLRRLQRTLPALDDDGNWVAHFARAYEDLQRQQAELATVRSRATEAADHEQLRASAYGWTFRERWQNRPSRRITMKQWHNRQARERRALLTPTDS